MREHQLPPPLGRPARRDPVLRETINAIMWVSHAIASVAEGRPELARHMLELAKESCLKALAMADPSENT